MKTSPMEGNPQIYKTNDNSFQEGEKPRGGSVKRFFSGLLKSNKQKDNNENNNKTNGDSSINSSKQDLNMSQIHGNDLNDSKIHSDQPYRDKSLPNHTLNNQQSAQLRQNQTINLQNQNQRRINLERGFGDSNFENNTSIIKRVINNFEEAFPNYDGSMKIFGTLKKKRMNGMGRLMNKFETKHVDLNMQTGIFSYCDKSGEKQNLIQFREINQVYGEVDKNKEGSKSFPFSFIIMTKKRTYNFACKSSHEREQWVSSLKMLIEYKNILVAQAQNYQQIFNSVQNESYNQTLIQNQIIHNTQLQPGSTLESLQKDLLNNQMISQRSTENDVELLTQRQQKIKQEQYEIFKKDVELRRQRMAVQKQKNLTTQPNNITDQSQQFSQENTRRLQDTSRDDQKQSSNILEKECQNQLEILVDKQRDKSEQRPQVQNSSELRVSEQRDNSNMNTINQRRGGSVRRKQSLKQQQVEQNTKNNQNQQAILKEFKNIEQINHDQETERGENTQQQNLSKNFDGFDQQKQESNQFRNNDDQQDTKPNQISQKLMQNQQQLQQYDEETKLREVQRDTNEEQKHFEQILSPKSFRKQLKEPQISMKNNKIGKNSDFTENPSPIEQTSLNEFLQQQNQGMISANKNQKPLVLSKNLINFAKSPAIPTKVKINLNSQEQNSTQNPQPQADFFEEQEVTATQAFQQSPIVVKQLEQSNHNSQVDSDKTNKMPQKQVLDTTPQKSHIIVNQRSNSRQKQQQIMEIDGDPDEDDSIAKDADSTMKFEAISSPNKSSKSVINNGQRSQSQVQNKKQGSLLQQQSAPPNLIRQEDQNSNEGNISQYELSRQSIKLPNFGIQNQVYSSFNQSNSKFTNNLPQVKSQLSLKQSYQNINYKQLLLENSGPDKDNENNNQIISKEPLSKSSKLLTILQSRSTIEHDSQIAQYNKNTPNQDIINQSNSLKISHQNQKLAQYPQEVTPQDFNSMISKQRDSNFLQNLEKKHNIQSLENSFMHTNELNNYPNRRDQSVEKYGNNQSISNVPSLFNTPNIHQRDKIQLKSLLKQNENTQAYNSRASNVQHRSGKANHESNQKSKNQQWFSDGLQNQSTSSQENFNNIQPKEQKNQSGVEGNQSTNILVNQADQFEYDWDEEDQQEAQVIQKRNRAQSSTNIKSSRNKQDLQKSNVKRQTIKEVNDSFEEVWD
eukprot:403358367